MDFKKRFEADPSKMNNGIWMDMDDEGCAILVARVDNDLQRKDYNERLKQAHGKYATTELTMAQLRKLEIENIAHTILLGWKGFTENGVEVKFSIEKAIEFMTIGPDFLTIVKTLAGRTDLFLAHRQEEIIKNS